MHYLALACDYDGTLARDGVVSPQTIDALEHVRASGRKLILITGRLLEDLQMAFPRLDLFTFGVAENDHSFLSLCECSVAVANAIPSLKEQADYTTKAENGDGVIELIEQLLADD